MSNGRYWLQTLGCPKNQVDSDKLAGRLAADGYQPAADPAEADLVVVNTCAFIEAARQESIDVVLELAELRADDARLVVTGCMAERYGDELAAALPEVDLVAGFGQALAPPVPRAPAVPVALGPARRGPTVPKPPVAGSFDLLELPRPAAGAPWAYVKVAEGCDRICGFCAIPSFGGKQRSRRVDDVLAETAALAATGPDGAPGVQEVVLVAQDLASFGRDRAQGRGTRRPGGPQPIVALTRAVSALVPRTRLLYLYPSGLTDELVSAVLDTGVPYFDLSLQHVSRPLLARMRRWGDGDRFLRRIGEIRAADPAATFRSSFILGYPGETEEDHDALLAFLEEAGLDWAGFFLFSPEAGTHAAGLPDQVPAGLAAERLRECAELQDGITARRRDMLVGQVRQVLVDAPGVGRTVHEAPEIDGVVHVPATLPVGSLAEVSITGSLGTELVAEPVGPPLPAAGALAGSGPVTDAAGERTFGPSALATPANALTIARLLATPVFVALIVVKGASWWTVAVGLVVAGSDGLDGWVARRQGTTRSGAFLDPLADKVVVLASMVALVAKGFLPWEPVALIALREVGMSVYRSWAGRRGISIPARQSAKVKTLVQDLAIAVCLVPPLATYHDLQLGFIWAAAALTVWTGVEYLLDGRRAARAGEA